jgi:serine protease inhibitor
MNIDFIPDETDACSLSVRTFTDAINKWLEERKTNLIVNLTIMYCKKMTKDVESPEIFFKDNWHEYKKCDTSENLKVFSKLKYNGQWGYNVQKGKMIGLDLEQDESN